MSTSKFQRHIRYCYDGVTTSLTNGGHIKIHLPNGRFVICSSTPSDWRVLKKIDRDIRRELRLG